MNFDTELVPQPTGATSDDHESFSCDVCHQTFTTHLNLTVHKQTHETENQYKCSYCGKMFSKRQYWRVHELGHSRPFRCELCNQSFTRQYNLTVHLRVHTGEKPFRCDECGQTFTRQYTLVLHKRMHSGEKPHECPICGRRFSRMQTMRSHVKTHNSEHVCSKCNLVFAKQEKLDRHIQTHHKGDKPYICNICGFRCSFSSSLQRHKEKHSAENIPVEALQSIDKTPLNPNALHPAQVTRLEQSIGFLRDNQDQTPPSNNVMTSSTDQQLYHNDVHNFNQPDTGWMVLNDGRIVNVSDSPSTSFQPPITSTAGQRSHYYPMQVSPPIMCAPTGLTSPNQSPTVAMDTQTGSSRQLTPISKQETERSSCEKDKEIRISNICSLSPNTNMQMRDTNNRSNTHDSMETSESSDNTLESNQDVSPGNSSSLLCIEQMLHRQGNEESGKASQSQDTDDETTQQTKQKSGENIITGSQKRKAGLMNNYGMYRNITDNGVEARDETENQQTSPSSEVVRKGSYWPITLKKFQISDSTKKQESFFSLGNTGRQSLDVRERERVQTTDISTSTVNKQSRRDGPHQIRQRKVNVSRANSSSSSEQKTNQPKHQSAIATSSSTPSPNKTWKCHHCGITFDDNVLFIIHMGCHGNQHPFQCNSCGHQCDNKVDFMLHFISGKHEL